MRMGSGSKGQSPHPSRLAPSKPSRWKRRDRRRKDYDDYDDYDDRDDSAYHHRYDDYNFEAYEPDRYDDGYDDTYDERYDDRYDDLYDDRYDDAYDDRYDDRYDDDYDDREPYPYRRRPAVNRGWVRRAFWTFYKVLVAISAVIVLGYLAFCIAVRPPEQSELPQNDVPPAEQLDGPAVNTDGPPGSTLERRKNVYTVLLAATDEEGFRTDTMMVMTYDIPNQKVGVVSIPRDTLTRREKGKNPRLVYGPGGVEERREDIAKMLGVPIDYYVKVNIKGFIALVDYLGGVDFYIPCDMNYDDPYQGGKKGLHIHYKQGQHHLNGQQAMEVARFRKNNDLSGYSDVGRTQTQQALLVALAEKLISWDSITKINGFVKIFNEHVETDMKMNDMLYFASQAFDGAKNRNLLSTVETATLDGRGDGVYHGKRWCFELDQEKTVETVNRLVNPYTRPLTLEDMDLIRADSYMQ